MNFILSLNLNLRLTNDDILGGTDKLPRLLTETLKAVHSTKWKLVRLRQEQGKSYKEVCAPMVEKCRQVLSTKYYRFRVAVLQY